MNVFEEFDERRRKIKFLSRSSIDFSLYGIKIGLVHLPEISSFRKILPEEFVGILDSSFLPGAERVCKIYCGSDSSGEPLVVHELNAVIGRNGKDMSLVWQQQTPRRHGYLMGSFGCQLRLQEHVRLALDHCQNSAFLTFAYNKIHLPVSESCAVCLCWTLMNRHTVRNKRTSCRLAFKPFMMPVLHLVPTVLPEFSRLIGTYFLIDTLVADEDALLSQIARNLFGRPVIFP